MHDNCAHAMELMVPGTMPEPMMVMINRDALNKLIKRYTMLARHACEVMVLTNEIDHACAAISSRDSPLRMHGTACQLGCGLQLARTITMRLE